MFYRTPDLVDVKYIPAPVWVQQLPSMSHLRQGGKGRLPFTFLQSNPQTDAVVNFVIKRIIKRAHDRGYTRSSKRDVRRKFFGDHKSGPWFQLVCDVLKWDCQSLTKSDTVIAAKLLARNNTSRENAERCVTSFELNTRDVLYAKQVERNRLLHRLLHIHKCTQNQ